MLLTVVICPNHKSTHKKLESNLDHITTFQIKSSCSHLDLPITNRRLTTGVECMKPNVTSKICIPTTWCRNAEIMTSTQPAQYSQSVVLVV